MDIVLIGFIASFFAGIATSVGALPVFNVNQLKQAINDILLNSYKTLNHVMREYYKN